jgi:hypothetical protein
MPPAIARSTAGAQSITTLLEQRISAGGWRYWYECGLNLFLDRDFDRDLDRDRRYDIQDVRILRRIRKKGRRQALRWLSGGSRAAAHALFAVSLAFLVGAFARGGI